MTLKELEIGESAIISRVGGEGELRQHFLDMGMIPGAKIKLVKYAPLGDPMELLIHGYELTLRLAEAEQIQVEKKYPKSFRSFAEEHEDPDELKPDHLSYPYLDADGHERREHPRLGEGEHYDKENQKNRRKDRVLTFALAGNQNSGKTTLFNSLTGSNQHVGNFPGVTVDRKTGSIRGIPNTEVTDLPGIYSMSPYTSEERVSRQFVLQEKPDAIINIVDATNIERNLYLTMQLIELNVPLVVALNMMDELQGNGGSVRINQMEELLGVPVVPISAVHNEGVHELIDHAIHVARYKERPQRMDFCASDDHGGAVHRALHGIMHLIEDHAEKAGIPIRFAATKVVENDQEVLAALDLQQNEKETIDHIVRQMEEERGLDRSAAIADMRFAFIEMLVSRTVVKPRESKERQRTLKIDQILTGKYTAIPCFILIMALVFALTFHFIGQAGQDLMEQAILSASAAASHLLIRWDVNPILRSLITDGIFNGVGSVISFLPIIVTLFFFLSLLEDTGYMARIAFVMDKLLRRIGLSGRSIVPMLMGFGCSVPAVMSSRTLPSDRDRKMTILLIPFMSCSAKLPVYAFFTAVFFPEHGALIMVSLYLLGILMGIFVAWLFRKTLFKGEPVPFVMELPNYRMPSAKNIAQLLWEKARGFLARAFSVILIASIVIWFFQSFDFRFTMVQESSASMLAFAAGKLAPVFRPMGLGDWRIVTALIAGFMAKESVVSTINVLYGSTRALMASVSTLSAAAFLVFCLLYTPCVAAITSVRKELGGRWALGMVILQCVVAWLVAMGVYLIGGAVFGF